MMWEAAKAPSLAELEAMAHDILARLPKTFRDLCEGVVVRVEDFPTEEILDEMNAESEFDLLGLFHGVGLPQQSQSDIARLPNLIWLYRRPILDYWAEDDETLGGIVRHVLIHEIGITSASPTTTWLPSRQTRFEAAFWPFMRTSFAINHRSQLLFVHPNREVHRWKSSPRWKAALRR
jgi:predicted Zn-dependent protease with MMP-like domain